VLYNTEIVISRRGLIHAATAFTTVRLLSSCAHTARAPPIASPARRPSLHPLCSVPAVSCVITSAITLRPGVGGIHRCNKDIDYCTCSAVATKSDKRSGVPRTVQRHVIVSCVLPPSHSIRTLRGRHASVSIVTPFPCLRSGGLAAEADIGD
jgi:hypothetical protein